jgi:hypothetical protein
MTSPAGKWQEEPHQLLIDVSAHPAGPDDALACVIGILEQRAGFHLRTCEYHAGCQATLFFITLRSGRRAPLRVLRQEGSIIVRNHYTDCPGVQKKKAAVQQMPPVQLQQSLF